MRHYPQQLSKEIAVDSSTAAAAAVAAAGGVGLHPCLHVSSARAVKSSRSICSAAPCLLLQVLQQGGRHALYDPLLHLPPSAVGFCCWCRRRRRCCCCCCCCVVTSAFLLLPPLLLVVLLRLAWTCIWRKTLLLLLQLLVNMLQGLL
jgi:hypothetical protein